MSASFAACAGPYPPTSGRPSREWVAVTVMITPDLLGTIRRAAKRAVRKYDLFEAEVNRYVPFTPPVYAIGATAADREGYRRPHRRAIRGDAPEYVRGCPMTMSS